ncbi:MAG: Gfo/Idh/MocA family oxidoreductase [Caldilineaceae bacterium]
MALPSHFHTDAAIAGLAAGKHVVVEKPMATSLADADRMVAAAAEADTVLSIFQNRRYNPDFVKVRSLIDAGIFGRIVQVRITESRFGRRWDWQTQRKFGGGTLNNTCPHFLDQALQLFGPTEPDVFCHLDRTLTLGDADDHVKVVLKGDGAPTIDVEVSSACAYPGETWNIMGTQGGLAAPPGTALEMVRPSPVAAAELDFNPTPDRSYNRDEIPWQEGSWSLDEDDTPGYAGYYLDLVRHHPQRRLAVTPESVRRVIWLQETCHAMAGF